MLFNQKNKPKINYHSLGFNQPDYYRKRRFSLSLGRLEIEIGFARWIKLSIRAMPYVFLVFFVLLSSNIPYINSYLGGLSKKAEDSLSTQKAKADYQYTPTANQINNSDGTQRYNGFNQLRAVDGSTWTTSPVDITGADTSLDIETTIGGVQQQGANKLILTFRASTNATALHYVFSVYDNTAGIWRPLNNHTAFNPALPNDLTNFYSQELTPAAASTFYTYQFEVFDGYFADTTTAPGTAISTPISSFISSNNIKLRVSSNDDCDTNVWLMNWDFAQVEVAIDPGYAPSSVNKTTGGTWNRYYSDVFTSNNAEAATVNTNSLTLPSSGNAVDFDFTFDDISPPVGGANTILLWYEGATSVINLSGSLKIYFWNYTTSGWEATAVSSGNASSTTVNQNRIMMFSTPLTNHISTSGGTRSAKIRVVASHTLAFNVYVDWLKLIIGSTNEGTQQNNVSIGTASGNLSDAGNVDTTNAAPPVWTLTSGTAFTNQFYGDNPTPSTNAVAADFSVPITEPSNANITGVHLASRTNDSSATPVTPVGLWNCSGGWSDFQTRAAGAAYVQHPYMVSGNVYRYPVWGSFGTATAATTASDVPFGTSPQDYHDSNSNLSGFKIRSSTGLAGSYTVGVDFAFLSIRYVSSEVQFTTQFTPSLGTKNVGGTETNNWRYTKANEAQSWTIANSGAGTGVDVDLEFRGVTLPSGYNRLIINSKHAWSVANSTHNMQIYDYTNSVWRNLAPHGQALTDYMLAGHNTAATQQYYQFEVYDGYFRNTSTTPGAAISTPLTNFVGTGADLGKVKIKYVRGTTTSNLSVDFAQLEVALDNTYYPRSASNVVGTSPARFYNDVTYPDNTPAAAAVHNYSYTITKATSGTDRLDSRFNFENITVPYDGANAILVDTQFGTSQANPVMSVQIYNYNTLSWETLNGNTTPTQTANYYYRYQFIVPVTTWSNYINTSAPNDIRLRYYTTNTTAGIFYLDYNRITLGSVTTAGDSSEVSWGTSAINDKTYTANLDATLLPSLTANWNKGWYINSQSDMTASRTLDAPASVAANINFPATRPANSLVTGIRWAIRAQSGASTMTIAPYLRDKSTYYATLTNAQYLLWFGAIAASSNLGYAPAAADAITLGTTAQVFTSGLYQISPEDTLDTQANKLNMAVRTTASTSLLEQTAIWDLAFVSLRYVVLPDTGVITIGTTGSQVTNLNVNSSNNYIGGAFTAVRNSSSANITQIIVSDTGTVNANANLSNLDLYYETAGTCTYDGNETLFGTVASFNASDKATVSGTMPTGTSQVCIYPVLDVGSGASAGQTIELEITNPSTEVTVSSGSVAPGTTIAISGTTTLQASNQNPVAPTSLVQMKTNDTVLATGDWTNENSVKFTATVTDPDSDQVRLCVEKDILGTSFSDTEDLCGDLVNSGQTAFVTIPSQTDASEYHWQARAEDANDAYSSWAQYGGNAESARDYGIDTTAPTGGTVYDGTSGDQDWNDGSLTQISANWLNFNSNVSGLQKYEYAIRRGGDDYYWSVCSGAGAWQAGANWCDNTTSTSFTQNNLNLQTSVTYYVSVRTTDVAMNVATPINSNGQQVLPNLSFTLAGNPINFADLNNSNNWTDSQTSTVTTSTNASAGYNVKVYETQLLTSLAYPSETISDFAGTWIAPILWPNGLYGFGYTSSDSLVQGSNRFLDATKYATFTQNTAGDIIADHTDAINGSTGSLVNETFTATYKVAVPQTQSASSYRTYVVYSITANY